MTKLFVQLCMDARIRARDVISRHPNHTYSERPDMSDTASLEDAHTSSSGSSGHGPRGERDRAAQPHEDEPQGSGDYQLHRGNVGPSLSHMPPRFLATIP